ncbi:hippurate hydrolase [Propionicimonas paludicola]|uniref:Hippurate hydrolase n=1 Tax=Propionicimonas paludicola TaxID=185243 RepID=A0A2A9CWK0_9ACTN|nr:amidohydrolase [Propionicimonas paludicola]PFG18375.1 hippurate hydrolase [Propionicimonas paludicola]
MTSRPIVDPSTDAAGLAEVYRWLHAHPELSNQEVQTADVLAQSLTALGYQVHTGVGGTGVVGLLSRGEGPTVLLRADMDGLPVAESTGLDYASTARGIDPDGKDVPVMHACGHDMHVICLLGAAAQLAADPSWTGTLMLVGQPAEELGTGALAMLADDLYERFGRPDVVLGQHVGPLPAGYLGLHPGPAFASSDALKVTLFGAGGHGSRPEACVDPIVMAAAVVLRLQTIVSREVAGGDSAVVTVGTLHAGTKMNIIPDRAELEVNVRSYDNTVREKVLASVERIIRAEALASGAPREPEIVYTDQLPLLFNDPDASARTATALAGVVGPRLIDQGALTGSEDVGHLATAAGVPCVYWVLGGADPALFAEATDAAGLMRVLATIPSNHSSGYAPVIEPTISVGSAALAAAAKQWLGN